MQIFISVHNQDLILQLEKNRCFRNIKNYKYLFLGNRPIDKLESFKERVIIARDLPDNIENEKALYDYTGWYALVKNNLIKEKFFVVVQYDCYLKENFEKIVNEALKTFPDKFIGFQPNSNLCNFWVPEQFSHSLAQACKKIYNIDIKEAVNKAYSSGDTIWTGGGTFAGSKKWLENFINWVEPMKSIIINDKMAAHNIERSIKIFNVVNNIKEIYLPDCLEHIFNCSHDQIYQSDDMRKKQQSRFISFINGDLFLEKEEENLSFTEKLFSLKNINNQKYLTFLGIKIPVKSSKLQIRSLEAEKLYLNSEIYKRDEIIYEREKRIRELESIKNEFIERPRVFETPIYVFDMDGTLTPARKPMTEEFAKEFLPWLKTHKAYIATGSDYKKIEEQLPKEVINAFTGVYCSMGNTFYKQGTLVFEKVLKYNEEMLEDLENFRKNTKYPNTLFDNYIEKRPGMINFSVIGRNCPYEEREKYTAWDKENGERKQVQKFMEEKYTDYDFELGGNISIDIIPKGCGKGQIGYYLRKIYPYNKIIFLGDRTMPGGNDYALASELKNMDNTKVVQVENPDEVLDFLLNKDKGKEE